MASDSLYYLYTLYAFLYVTFGLVVFFSKGNRIANRVLAMYLCAITLSFFHYSYIVSGMYEAYTLILALTWLCYFSLGPLFHLYTRFVLGYSFEGKEESLHFILPFIVFIVTIVLSFLQPINGNQSFLLADEHVFMQENHWTAWTLKSLFLSHFIFYELWSLALVYRYEKLLKHVGSRHSSLVVHWLKILIVANLGMYVTNIPWSTLIPHTLVVDLFPLVHYMVFMFLVYHLLRQPKRFEHSMKTKLTWHAFNLCAMFWGSRRKCHELTQLHFDAVRHIKKHKLYANPHLKAEELAHSVAEALNAPMVKLLEATHKVARCNFRECLNIIRLDVAHEILKKEKQMEIKLDHLCTHIGYSDVQRFIRHFKSRFGKEPSVMS